MVQPCVVTLDPVTTRIDQPLRRRLAARDRRGRRPRSCWRPTTEDEPEPLGDRIDLGLVATEALALAVPAYPRKPGAALRPAGGAEAGRGPAAALRRAGGAARETR